jgi:hypothetical protein
MRRKDTGTSGSTATLTITVGGWRERVHALSIALWGTVL